MTKGNSLLEKEKENTIVIYCLEEKTVWKCHYTRKKCCNFYFIF